MTHQTSRQLNEETRQYDRQSEEDGIFAGYINNFLKIKQEPSGYPFWCQTDDDRQNSKTTTLKIKAYDWKEGRRAFSKIVLNSLWGKLEHRTNLTKTEYIANPSEYFKSWST